MSKKPKKTRVSIALTKFFIDDLDTLIRLGIYNEYQDAIRQGLRDLFKKHDQELNP